MTDPMSLFLRAKAAEAAADVQSMRRLFAGDATMYEPYLSGTRSGPGVAEYMGTVCGTEFAKLEYKVVKSLVDGSQAVIELEEVVTLLDGKLAHLRNCTIVECRDGLIVRWFEYLQPMKRRP